MKYNLKMTADICDNLKTGMNREDTCLLLGIHRDTFYSWMKKADFSDAIKKAETECKKRNITIIQKAAITTWQAAAWWLERKHRDEFGLRVEHIGDPAKPIAYKIINA